jgi:transposase
MVYIKSDPKQRQLLPTDLTTIIDKNHICYLIENFIHSLDYSDFDREVEGSGNPSYHPRILLKILIYGVFERVTSSRKLERATHENIVFRYLTESLHPDFRTIARFRKENTELLKQCFLQTVELGKELDMINFNKLYLDGTKIKANASKSKTFSKEEVDFLSEFVDKQIAIQDKNDFHENKRYGKKNNGEPKIPKELTNRRKLKDKIKQFLKDKNKAKKELDSLKNKLKEEKLDKINLTDTDSKMSKMKKGIHFEQAYNCQLLVEEKSELLVCNYISNSSGDIAETIPAMEKFKSEQNIDLKGKQVCQDNGYSSIKTAQYYKDEEAIALIPDQRVTKELHGKAYKIDDFDNDKFELDFKKNQAICPIGHIMKFVKKEVRNKKINNWTNIYRCDKCLTCEFKTNCVPKKSKFRDVKINPLQREIRLRFKDEKYLKEYNKRFHKGEIAQAYILHSLGYRDFQTRGLKNCEGELNLVSTAYNLRRITNFINKKGIDIAIAMQKMKKIGKNAKNNVLKINKICNFRVVLQYI